MNELDELRVAYEKLEARVERRIARERKARAAAEQLLEEKSTELYAAHERLQAAHDVLEDRVLERTNALEVAQSRMERRVKRERTARKSAEQLLEQKSSELFTANEQLQAAHDELEERVRARTRDLELAKTEIEAADRAKTLFLANMSHEIRTPLNGVIGMADFLLTGGLSADLHDAAETIKDSSESLLSILSDILDFAKLDAGTVKLKPESADARTQIQQLAATFNEPTLRVTIDEAVPARVSIDSERLTQVIAQLLQNAISHADATSIELAIGYSDARLHIRVADNGRGIAPKRLEMLFQPFYSLEQSGYRGTRGRVGIELATCHRAVGMMGGTLEVDSTLDVGTTFSFSIDAPVAKAKLIAVIEPNRVNRRVVMTLLRLLKMDAVDASAAVVVPADATVVLAGEGVEIATEVPIIRMGEHAELPVPVSKEKLKSVLAQF